MYKGIIFDLDGTLLDTIDDLTDAVNHTLIKYGFPIRKREEILSFVGHGARELINKAVPVDQKHLVDEVLTDYKNYYDSHARIKTKPYQGITDMLIQLKDRFKLGVVSNKQDQAVKQLVSHYFEPIFIGVIGESKQIPKKPDPSSVLKVIEAMNLSPQEVIFVGDSEVDIETANNVSCDMIAVTWGFRSKDILKSLNPTYLINHPSEILDIIGE